MASLKNPSVDFSISRLGEERKVRRVVKISVCICGDMASEQPRLRQNDTNK
jgi:hypothetical protein